MCLSTYSRFMDQLQNTSPCQKGPLGPPLAGEPLVPGSLNPASLETLGGKGQPLFPLLLLLHPGHTASHGAVLGNGLQR